MVSARRRAAVLVLCLLALAGYEAGLGGSACVFPSSFRDEMRAFVCAISVRARADRPGFLIVPQNAEALLTADGSPEGEAVSTYVACIDGLGREDLSYGYESDGVATPEPVRDGMLSLLLLGIRSGLSVLVVDYCTAPAQVAECRRVDAKHGFAGFAAPTRALDSIPSDAFQPFGGNDRAIDSLSEASNVLYLLNPARLPDRSALVRALRAVPYDVLILDPYDEEGLPLSEEDVAALKVKPSGARRLVLAYLSVGEAEDYRPYWRAEWVRSRPDWLLGENPDWPGNYLVDYANPLWQRIVFAALAGIVTAGFDGAYLDRVDAYESFEPSS